MIVSVPAETRTLGPLIKSQLLYQLSYGDRVAKVLNSFYILLHYLHRK